MLNLIDGFYDLNDLGLMTLSFINYHFESQYQSGMRYYGGDRLLGYPTYETKEFVDFKDPLTPYNIFMRTWIKKTNIQPLHVSTFFRKTKLSECKASPSWKQYKQHRDDNFVDMAGLIYFNSNTLKDGTYFFNDQHDYEPTAIIGSKVNRCIFYPSEVWHAPSMEQSVEERWTQPFFIIHKEETLKKYKEKKNI